MGKFHKFTAIALSAVMLASVVACGNKSSEDSGIKKVAMVTDLGGIDDKSFNSSAWYQGLDVLQKEHPDLIKAFYLESRNKEDYPTHLRSFVKKDVDLIWGIGYALGGDILTAAQENDESHFAIVDYGYEEKVLAKTSNLAAVSFRSQESSFMVGVVAALFAHLKGVPRVGFIGGKLNDIIYQFEYGYKAGIDFANKIYNLSVKVFTTYIDTFDDAARGLAAANRMFDVDDVLVIFHAAGKAGNGVIQSAKEHDRYAIGVDRDQSDLAPKHVLTSALKNVGKAMQELSTKYLINGEEIGGKNYVYGIKEGCVGIPEKHDIMGDDIYNKAMEIQKKILDGSIVPPKNKEEYESWKKDSNIA